MASHRSTSQLASTTHPTQKACLVMRIARSFPKQLGSAQLLLCTRQCAAGYFNSSKFEQCLKPTAMQQPQANLKHTAYSVMPNHQCLTASRPNRTCRFPQVHNCLVMARIGTDCSAAAVISDDNGDYGTKLDGINQLPHLSKPSPTTQVVSTRGEEWRDLAHCADSECKIHTA